MRGHNSGIDVEKYEWSKVNVVMFVEIIYDKVKQNKLQTSTFSNVVWEEINKELYQATKTNYGVDRLKGKWNRLRIRQRLFAALLAHTGVTMNPDTGKVNAPEEVWAEFYMIMSSSDDEYDELGPAIDGTHVSAWTPSSIQTSFHGRKVIVTQNVMLAFDFDMLFTFVYTGWEGTANDSRVFIDALTRHENNFPKPYGGDFNNQESIPIDSSQTAQMGNVHEEIASNMWNDYMEHPSSLQ
ncbi:hypothetical protein ZIOFF_035787 [Zingiber officinale]|uniref:Myb/SANT-like domain-containing protein n=1 Tax=Zingiber officinale TaxID=94328 RepID=A0A8J5L2X3_ZINOF|nr:hypothetical protein ZIOFF_035787 [Zingiber officinale]